MEALESLSLWCMAEHDSRCDGSGILHDLQAAAGSSAELPLWLCKVLVSKELVKVKRPQFLGDR